MFGRKVSKTLFQEGLDRVLLEITPGGKMSEDRGRHDMKKFHAVRFVDDGGSSGVVNKQLNDRFQ